MFDVNNLAHRQALRAEVDGDAGLTAMSHDTHRLVATLNDRSLGGGNVTIPIEDLSIIEVSNVIVKADYNALDTFDKISVDSFRQQPPIVRLEPFMPMFQSLFAGTATMTAAQALRVRGGSRVERLSSGLLGVGAVVNRTDWIKSRKS